MQIKRHTIDILELKEGMVLAEPIFDFEGKLLFYEDLQLNQNRIDRIFRLDIKTVVIKYTINKVSDDIIKDKTSKILLNDAREEASKSMKNIIDELIDNNSVKSDKIVKIVEKIMESILNDDKIALNLSNLSIIDDYVLSHSVNVCVLALVTGIFLGFNTQELLVLGSGALIHDIGKMLVPKHILLKSENLVDEEYKIVQQHTIFGYKILKENMKFSEKISSIALSHHERVDGNGYPNNLKEEDLNIYVKIVCIADVFDAITTDRVYCEKINYYDAVKYLLVNAGTQFDLEVVKKFITIIGYYPLGLNVKLNTKDEGIVIKKNKLVPIIKVIKDSYGNNLENYYEIDLNKNPLISIIDIDIKKYKRKRSE